MARRQEDIEKIACVREGLVVARESCKTAVRLFRMTIIHVPLSLIGSNTVKPAFRVPFVRLDTWFVES